MKTIKALGIGLIAGYLSISFLPAPAQTFPAGGYQGGQYGKGGIENSTGIEDITYPIDEQFIIFPNPVRDQAILTFVLSENARIELAIFDMTNRKVRTVGNSREHKPGKHTVTWNGTDDSGGPLANGVYYCRLTTGKKVLTRKFIMIR